MAKNKRVCVRKVSIAKKKKVFVQTRPRYNGISIAAAALDVSEGHLRFCLNGDRESPRLMARVRKQFPELLKDAI